MINDNEIEAKNLKFLYKDLVFPNLVKQFNYKNNHQVPKLVK